MPFLSTSFLGTSVYCLLPKNSNTCILHYLIFSEIVNNITSAIALKAKKDRPLGILQASPLTVKELQHGFSGRAAPSLTTTSKMKRFAKKYQRF